MSRHSKINHRPGACDRRTAEACETIFQLRNGSNFDSAPTRRRPTSFQRLFLRQPARTRRWVPFTFSFFVTPRKFTHVRHSDGPFLSSVNPSVTAEFCLSRECVEAIDTVNWSKLSRSGVITSTCRVNGNLIDNFATSLVTSRK